MPLNAPRLDPAALERMRVMVRDAAADLAPHADPHRERVRSIQRRLASQIADIAVEMIKEIGELGSNNAPADIGPLIVAMNMLAVSPVRNIMANCFGDTGEVQRIAEMAIEHYITAITAEPEDMDATTHEVTRTQ